MNTHECLSYGGRVKGWGREREQSVGGGLEYKQMIACHEYILQQLKPIKLQSLISNFLFEVFFLILH